jgi:hypothetical protein
MSSGLRRVNSLELLMRESPTYSSQQSSFNQTPHEVSTLGSSDKDMLSTTQEEVLLSHPPAAPRASFKTSHFETILQTQRHTEMITKLERNYSSSQAVIAKLQSLEDKCNDMSVKLLSVEANVTLLSQMQSEHSSAMNFLLKQLLDETRSTRLTATPNLNTHTPLLSVLKKRKCADIESKHSIKNSEEEGQFVDMADYLKSKYNAKTVTDTTDEVYGGPRGSGNNSNNELLDNMPNHDDMTLLSDITSSPILYEQEKNDTDDFIFDDM